MRVRVHIRTCQLEQNATGTIVRRHARLAEVSRARLPIFCLRISALASVQAHVLLPLPPG